MGGPQAGGRVKARRVTRKYAATSVGARLVARGRRYVCRVRAARSAWEFVALR